MHGKPLTESEIQLIRELAPTMTRRQLAKRIGKHYSTINRVIASLHLKCVEDPRGKKALELDPEELERRKAEIRRQRQ